MLYTAHKTGEAYITAIETKGPTATLEFYTKTQANLRAKGPNGMVPPAHPYHNIGQPTLLD